MRYLPGQPGYHRRSLAEEVIGEAHGSSLAKHSYLRADRALLLDQDPPTARGTADDGHSLSPFAAGDTFLTGTPTR